MCTVTTCKMGVCALLHCFLTLPGKLPHGQLEDVLSWTLKECLASVSLPDLEDYPTNLTVRKQAVRKCTKIKCFFMVGTLLAFCQQNWECKFLESHLESPGKKQRRDLRHTCKRENQSVQQRLFQLPRTCFPTVLPQCWVRSCSVLDGVVVSATHGRHNSEEKQRRKAERGAQCSMDKTPLQNFQAQYGLCQCVVQYLQPCSPLCLKPLPVAQALSIPKLLLVCRSPGKFSHSCSSQRTQHTGRAAVPKDHASTLPVRIKRKMHYYCIGLTTELSPVS